MSRDAALQGGDPRMSKPNGPRQKSKTRQREQRPVVSIVVNCSPLYTHPVPDSGYFRVTITFLPVRVAFSLSYGRQSIGRKHVRVVIMIHLPYHSMLVYIVYL